MLLTDLLERITREIVNPLIVLVFLLAVVVFGWGMVLYLGAQGSDEKVQTGKKIMWWGIVGMFILASMWGVVFLLCDFFGTCTSARFSFPDVPSASFPSGGPLSGPECFGSTAQCQQCYSPSYCTDAFGGGDMLTPFEVAACSDRVRCEPCAHFLDEGNPRAYIRCVKNILGF